MTILDICKEQFQIRIYKEGIVRIKKVLSLITEEDVWYRPNNESNSIGHLILHLCGNVTQWIGTGIGKRKDDRLRGLEFTDKEQYSKQHLIEQLHGLKAITDSALEQLQSDDDLLQSQTIQGYQETKLSILIHVIEHFSYHVGQIAVIAKYIKGQDLGFYEGQDLNVVG